MQEILKQDKFFELLFQAIPSVVLVVDAEGRVEAINNAAEKTFGITNEKVYLKKGGDVFNCIHSKEHQKGCGFSSNCERCTTRNTAMEAINGNSISRAKGKLNLYQGKDKDKEIVTVSLLISSAPLEYNNEKYAVVIIEDISNVTELEGLLPICSSCKKIRDDQGYWNNLEKYIQTHSEAEFTHGYCPDCMEKVYSQFRELGDK